MRSNRGRCSAALACETARGDSVAVDLRATAAMKMLQAVTASTLIHRHRVRRAGAHLARVGLQPGRRRALVGQSTAAHALAVGVHAPHSR